MTCVSGASPVNIDTYGYMISHGHFILFFSQSTDNLHARPISTWVLGLFVGGERTLGITASLILASQLTNFISMILEWTAFIRSLEVL